jgi:hypothetical protein
MKYLATIQTEFLKEARKWKDFSLEDQRAYLKRHPKSKRRFTSDKDSGDVGRKVDDSKKVMTTEEAMIYNKHSVIRGIFYHGTNNAKEFLKNGITHDGIYLTEDESIAKKFGKDIINVTMNVKSKFDANRYVTSNAYPTLEGLKHKGADVAYYHTGSNGNVYYVYDSSNVKVVSDEDKSTIYKKKNVDKKDLPKDSQTGKTITATKFTKQELFDAAKKAGQSLFKDHHTGLVFGSESPDDLDFEKVSLKKQQQSDDDDEPDYVDEYEYVFFPSTGKGLDVSSESWKKAKKKWADKDGNIYTCWAGDSIIVTTT